MARSLRDLVDYLLDEVSLCGNRGASVTDVLGFIDDFYAAPAKVTEATVDHGVNRTGGSGRVPNLDRRFKSKVWTWLMGRPDVFVGPNREGNSLSLDEMESRSQTRQALGNVDPEIRETDGSAAPSTLTAPTEEQDELRVFVSEEMMWLAITGHQPDTARVMALEFALLSIIASKKADGILQIDLSRLSGQDKRSVPRRTDVLQTKGYIEKRPVQYKSTRTSLCILRKFAGQATQGTSHDSGAIDLEAFLDNVVNSLKESTIISMDDMVAKLKLERRFVRKAIRRLETIGCVRRVNALSQYSDVTGKRYLSIMLVRDPTERDRKMFILDARNLTTPNDEDDPDNLEAEEDRAAGAAVVSQDESQDQRFIEIGRVHPQWVPGMNLANLIARLVHQSGPKGMTNLELTAACMGIFMRRAVETAASRLVETGQGSHSPHLRHLSLVRDSTVEGTQTHFLHYTLHNFAALVNEGKTSWEALESSGKRGMESLSSETDLEFDEYGFPISSTPPAGLLNGGWASLRECVQAAKPTAYNSTGHDPDALLLENGKYTVGYGGSYLTKKKRKHISLFANEQGSSAVEQGAVVGEKPKRRKKTKPDIYAGMSEKERLEAQGFDGTWTEYSLLCLERPGPGCYITPYGKRRPVGKARGRPGKSRIAVFKSEKLRVLGWFVAPEEEEEEQEEPDAWETPLESAEKPSTELVQQIEPSSTPLSGSVRPVRATATSHNYRALSPTPEDSDNEIDRVEERAVRATPPATLKRKQPETPGNVQGETDKPVRKRGRPPKKRKTETQDTRTGSREQAGAMETSDSRPTHGQQPEKRRTRSGYSGSFAEPMRVDEPHDQVVSSVPEARSIVDEDAQNPVRTRPRKTPDTSQPAMANEPSAGRPGGNAVLVREDYSVVPSVEPPLAPDPQGSRHTTGRSPSMSRNSTTRGQTAELETRASSILKLERQSEVGSIFANPKTKTMKRDTKGGSVALLRRNTIMDILKKCGGAYPLGTEIWYPFAKAWQKTNFSQKPDKKTIRSTVDTLTEQGKVRQYTFSGKNSKGIMVTKSLVAEAALEPDDPVITNLQAAILNADPQLYFPPGVEVEASSKKSLGGQLNRSKVPDLENPDVTVTLQQTPLGFQRHQERLKRREQREIDRSEGRLKKPRVRRLKSLNPRHIQGGTYLGPLTYTAPLIAPPVPLIPTIRAETRKMNKLVADGLAMLMAPRQAFHPATGTFGTGPRIPRGRPSSTPMHIGPSSATTHGNWDPTLHELKLSNLRSSTSADTPASSFFQELNAVQRWEMMNGLFYPSPDPDGNSQLMFINHAVAAPFESAPLHNFPAFISDLPGPSEHYFWPQFTRQKGGRHGLQLQSPNIPTPYQFHFHPRATKPANAPEARQKPTQNRGPAARRQRHINALPPHEAQKLTIAMIAVRTLTGGLDGRHVDWSLVTPLFPEYSVEFVQSCGKALSAKHRLQMAKMQSDFQERFARAYEKNEVPRIDFNNLGSYDWDWLVKWTERELEAPSGGQAPILPANRVQFDSLFEIREEPVQSIDEVYQPGSGPTISRKQSLLSSVPFSIPLKRNPSKTESESRASDDQPLKVAKTWVRANVVAPDESYQPADAATTIASLGGELIDRAVSSLMAERVLIMGHEGRITPGRNYHLTDFFMQSLARKRPIEPAELARAVYFKTAIVDENFRGDGKYEIPYSAEDGDILALVNLAYEGQIVLSSKDPPKTKYGFTGNSYLTRMMDKTKLRFTVEVRPVEGSYIYGDPIRELVDGTPVPRGELGMAEAPTPALGKIPLWIDVHGRLMKSMWDLVVCAVLGSLAVRPGLGVEAIVKVLQPCMGGWEVELVLEWLREVGAVQPMRNAPNVQNNGVVGWRTAEWWWMVIR